MREAHAHAHDAIIKHLVRKKDGGTLDGESVLHKFEILITTKDYTLCNLRTLTSSIGACSGNIPHFAFAICLHLLICKMCSASICICALNAI